MFTKYQTWLFQHCCPYIVQNIETNLKYSSLVRHDRSFVVFRFGCNPLSSSSSSTKYFASVTKWGQDRFQLKPHQPLAQCLWDKLSQMPLFSCTACFSSCEGEHVPNQRVTRLLSSMLNAGKPADVVHAAAALLRSGHGYASLCGPFVGSRSSEDGASLTSERVLFNRRLSFSSCARLSSGRDLVAQSAGVLLLPLDIITGHALLGTNSTGNNRSARLDLMWCLIANLVCSFRGSAPACSDGAAEEEKLLCFHDLHQSNKCPTGSVAQRA